MKKSDTSEQGISRRKAIGRIGLLATAAYTVPAFATLSMAHASGSSGVSSASNGTSTPSIASTPSAPSTPSVASGPSISIPSGVEALCSQNGVTADLANPEYVQCLIDNSSLLSPKALAKVLALTI